MHFKYFSKAKHCDFAAGSWQLACCYLLSQIYWLHQLHQTSKFASSSKMYIFWYRLIGLLQATYTAHKKQNIDWAVAETAFYVQASVSASS